jgi:hypothetical protein
MQKVEGSSPFSRLEKGPQVAGLFRLPSAVTRSRLATFRAEGLFQRQPGPSEWE